MASGLAPVPLVAAYLLPVLIAYAKRAPMRGLVAWGTVLTGWIPWLWPALLLWAILLPIGWERRNGVGADLIVTIEITEQEAPEFKGSRDNTAVPIEAGTKSDRF